jgi:hypothetical protein
LRKEKEKEEKENGTKETERERKSLTQPSNLVVLKIEKNITFL